MLGAFAKLKIDAISATTALESGTAEGSSVSDYFAADGVAPHGKSDKGGRKAYRVYDEETGKDMGVRFSGKEAILDEETSAALSPLIRAFKQTGALPSFEINQEADNLNPSVHISTQGMTKEDLEEVMQKAVAKQLEGYQKINDDKADFATFIPSGQSGQVYVEKGKSKRFINVDSKDEVKELLKLIASKL